MCESSWPVGSSARISRGREHQRPGHGHPLPLAAGEFARPVVEPAREADPLQQAGAAGDGLAGHPSGRQRRHEHVVEGRAAGQQVVLLKDEADPPVAEGGPGGGVAGEGIDAVEPDAARGRLLERPDDRQERALARTRGPHDRHPAARLERERDVVEHRHAGPPRWQRTWRVPPPRASSLAPCG